MVAVRGVVVLAAAAVALLAAGEASAARLEFFRTPSGNIGCISDGSFLRCDIRSGLEPRPKRPASCELDWGYGLDMSRTGRPHVVCAGDTAIDPGSKIIRYGKAWRRNGFVCTSRTTGLTCTNVRGHGFFLSRQSWRKF